MVPLPFQGQLWSREVIATSERAWAVSLYGLYHGVGYTSLFVAQHRPAVFPLAWHEGKYAPYSVTILKNNTVPLAILSIYNGALAHIGEAPKGAL